MSLQEISDDVTHLTKCLACDHDKLKLVLDLGKQPLANSFKLKCDDVQEEYPLAINHCERCYHVQLTHAVNPKLMFEDYLYVSGTAQTMHEHFRDFAVMVAGESPEAKTILDIGCNDGTQLDYFKEMGFETYGVDPAENLHKDSSEKHKIWCSWFDKDFIETCGKKKFDVIVAQNVFAHGSNPLGFLETAKELLSDNGVLYIQTSQANMIKNNEFDTIYHEHISFFNTRSMIHLTGRAGLILSQVSHMPIHGTSYIFKVTKGLTSTYTQPYEVMKQEHHAWLYMPETYVEYARRCNEIVEQLKIEVAQMTRNEVGWPAVGYGAPAKGMTLLNYSGLKLDYIIDDNPLKQGRFTPGSSIPIYPASKLDEYKDAICFVPLAWNFFDEIVKKIKARRNNKWDRFVTYFPKVETKE